MNSKRLRLILLGSIGGLVLVFVIVCVVGLSKLSTQSQNMVSLKLQSKVLDDQLTSLAQAKKQVQQYSYIKGVAAEVIPTDKDQAQAVLEISQLASDSGIAIQSVSFPNSTLGVVGASTSSLLSQAIPVSGIAGLYSVQLTITPQTGPLVPDSQQVTYAKMLDFLDRIEHNERTAQITQVIVQPQGGTTGDSVSSITFSLNINIFIKP